jgi:hypothetical protein
MRKILPADIEAMGDIMSRQDQLKQAQGQIKDDLKALADRLETKPARVNAILRLVRKEQAEPGAIEFEQSTLDAAEQISR